MSAISSEIENLKIDRDQWRELAGLEAEAARKAEARALSAEAALAGERERIAARLEAQANALWERCETKRTDPPSIDEQADAAQAFALQKAVATIRADSTSPPCS